MELWRNIDGYGDLLQASHLGRIRCVGHLVDGVLIPEKIVKPQMTDSGFLVVNLCTVFVQVHNLVAKAWFGPNPKGKEIGHGPGGKFDNSISNLCYKTIQPVNPELW